MPAPAMAMPSVKKNKITGRKVPWDGFRKYLDTANNVDPIKCVGHVVKVQGLLIESRGPQAIIGELCRIEVPKRHSGKFSACATISAEVVGLRNDIVQLMAYEETDGLEIGCRVIASGSRLEVKVSNKLLGRVLDPLGNPLDNKGPIEASLRYPALANPPDALKRRRITERVCTGVRAIDSLLAVGRGQRLGIFAGSGVGKSTLLGMIARNTSADVNVVALIGERGRELNDFIEKDLGPEGLARSVIIVTPSNSPPLCRLRGAYVATAVAEYFRDQGLDVMFLFDSVTRFARAQREIGLASGEPPATRGFPPSMFDSMPKLLERCGTSDKGTITGFYTVLVDGDDMDEPVADTVRGILDGHIVLSRALARQYHYPAIDILDSVSRLAPTVSGPETNKAAGVLRRHLAVYAEAEDLINVGAYKMGSNLRIDEAIKKRDALESFLIQETAEKVSLENILKTMGEIADIEIPEKEMEILQRKSALIQTENSEEIDDDEFEGIGEIEQVISEVAAKGKTQDIVSNNITESIPEPIQPPVEQAIEQPIEPPPVSSLELQDVNPLPEPEAETNIAANSESEPEREIETLPSLESLSDSLPGPEPEISPLPKAALEAITLPETETNISPNAEPETKPGPETMPSLESMTDSIPSLESLANAMPSLESLANSMSSSTLDMNSSPGPEPEIVAPPVPEPDMPELPLIDL